MCKHLNNSTLKYKRTPSVAQAEGLFFIMPSKCKSRTGWGSKESPLRSIPGAIVVVKPHSQSRPNSLRGPKKVCPRLQRLRLSGSHRMRVRTSNGCENVNRQNKARTRVVGLSERRITPETRHGRPHRNLLNSGNWQSLPRPAAKLKPRQPEIFRKITGHFYKKICAAL